MPHLSFTLSIFCGVQKSAIQAGAKYEGADGAMIDIGWVTIAGMHAVYIYWVYYVYKKVVDDAFNQLVADTRKRNCVLRDGQTASTRKPIYRKHGGAYELLSLHSSFKF